jgi:spore coat protein U-like protein
VNRCDGVRALGGVLIAACASAAGAATCSVESAGLAFGQYNPFRGQPNDSVGTISVACSGAAGTDLAYLIRIGPGSSGTLVTRTMRSSSGWALGYNLYTDPARSLVWGDGTGGTRAIGDVLTLGGIGQIRRHPVYGRTTERQNVPPGFYTDTLIVTVEF